jgi:hypothetical protein
MTCFAAGTRAMLLPGLDKAKSMPAERQQLLLTSKASVSELTKKDQREFV